MKRPRSPSIPVHEQPAIAGNDAAYRDMATRGSAALLARIQSYFAKGGRG
jgi:hypothetical protein